VRSMKVSVFKLLAMQSDHSLGGSSREVRFDHVKAAVREQELVFLFSPYV
jgi:hypothetical protein